MKALKLGTIVGDSVTGTTGMLTHLLINMQLDKQYIYQPRGLNPETQQPVKALIIEKKRVVGGEKVEYDIPLHLMGTEAEDEATGFEGTIIGMTLHINKCLHCELKPVGTLAKTGATIDSCEFDIRRLKGLAIPVLTEKEKAASEKEKPSPSSFERNR